MSSADHQWEYVEGAIAAAKRYGITNDQVRDAVLGPHNTTVPAKYGREKRISDDVTVIVEPKQRLILFITLTNEYDKHRPDESATGQRKISGGSSKKHYTIEELVDLAVDQGFTLRQGSKHKVLYPPDRSQGIIGIPLTASDWRAVRNLRAQLIRSGLRIDNE